MRRFWRRKTVHTHVPRTAPGVELRISNMNGTLVQATSERLYYIAKYGYTDDSAWLELIPGGSEPGSMYYAYDDCLAAPSRLKIEIRPVRTSAESASQFNPRNYASGPDIVEIPEL